MNKKLRQFLLGPLEIERTEGKPDTVTYLFRRTLYLRLTCATCHRALPVGATFCIACGEKV